MTRFVTLLVAMAFPLASIAADKPEPTQDNGKHEQAERGGSGKKGGSKGGGSKGSGSKGSGSGGSGQRSTPAPSSPQRGPGGGNGGSGSNGGSTSPSAPARSPSSGSNGSGSNGSGGGDRDGGGSGSDNGRSGGNGAGSPSSPDRSPSDNGGSNNGTSGTGSPGSPDRTPANGSSAAPRPGSPDRGPGASSGHTTSPGSPDRARPGTASMNNAQPVSRSVKVGSAAPAAALGTHVAASAHVPANFRTTSSAAAKSSNAVAAQRYNATHRAASARHVSHVAAVHRHNAVVAHHRSAVIAHHRAWARHHPYVWRPARAHGYVTPRWYWRPWHHGAHVYWYHGVFVYGPRPVHHHYYTSTDGGGGGGSAPPEAESPRRQIDRTQSWAVGLRGGSYLSGYDNGAGYGDAGIGVALRYRPVEALGLELQWQHHDETFGDTSERGQSPLSASVELFGVPWSRVNPYVLAGVTFNNRDIQDQIGPLTTVETTQTLWGPHGGLGIEFNIAERASVNFDVRGIGYLNVPAEDPTSPGALQANMGVNFYF